MSAEEQSISVNFGHPMALFPLPATVLLPQQVVPLHIFEPRYKQMVEHAMDSSGQFAIAVLAGDDWKQSYHGKPRIRPAVCVGRMVQHEKAADGTFNVLVQGVCRAIVKRELPSAEDRLYRTAMLEPLGVEAPMPASIEQTRARLHEMLSEGPLTKLVGASQVSQYLANEEIPSSTIVDLVSFALMHEHEIRYKLLAEGDLSRRAEIIETELTALQRLIQRAGLQQPERWPKGCSWN